MFTIIHNYSVICYTSGNNIWTHKMSHLKTPKLSKKKNKIDSDDTDSKELKESTTYQKFFGSLKFLNKDKNSEIRKSKRKLKSRLAIQEENDENFHNHMCNETNLLIKVDEADQSSPEYISPVVESVNDYLCNTLGKNEYLDINQDSKETSENESPSVYSDYSYNRLTTDTSEVSSRENISEDIEQIKKSKNLSLTLSPKEQIHEIDQNSESENDISKPSSDHPPFRKSKSLSRKNSFTKSIKRIFRKSKTDPSEILNETPPKLFKPASRKTSDTSNNSTQQYIGSIRKSSSIKKKISNFMSMNEVSQNLSRSMSVRDIKKANNSTINKPDVSEEWSASSFMSLVENDPGVLYKDFSFVNYDVFNTCSYDNVPREMPRKNFRRTHSMSMHNVSKNLLLSFLIFKNSLV